MIRSIVINDIEYLNFWLKGFDENFSNHYDLKYYLNNNNIYISIVYEINQKIVGYMLAMKLFNESEILVLYVDKLFRRQGIAKKLIDYLVNPINSKSILLEVSNKNLPALTLYENLDFKIINVRKNYYKDSDAYVMRKVI